MGLGFNRFATENKRLWPVLYNCDHRHLLYDFLLTLTDEVSYVVGIFFAIFIDLLSKINTLGRGENHGVRREDRSSYDIR